MKLTITVTKDELIQAAENLIYLQSLDKDTEADEEAMPSASFAIASIIKQHLENEIEERITNPEKYLKPEEWEEVNKCFVMSPTAFKKMMDRDIPYLA